MSIMGFIFRPITGAPMVRSAVMTFRPRSNMRPVSSEVKKRKGLAAASEASASRRVARGSGAGTVPAVEAEV